MRQSSILLALLLVLVCLLVSPSIHAQDDSSLAVDGASSPVTVEEEVELPGDIISDADEVDPAGQVDFASVAPTTTPAALDKKSHHGKPHHRSHSSGVNVHVVVDVEVDDKASSAEEVAPESTTPESDLLIVGGGYGGCKWNGRSGTCMDYRQCNGQSTTLNLCPGNSAIRCCVPNAPAPSSYGSCNWSGRAGTCMDYRNCAGESTTANLCPGSAAIRCCVPKGAAPPASSGADAKRRRIAEIALSRAGSKSLGWCAKYVADAIQGAGIPVARQAYAAYYGQNLLNVGFRQVAGEPKQVGDVRVIQAYRGQSPAAGHIQIWTGSIWVSDFRQSADDWPGQSYRNSRPAWKQYRYQG